MQGESPLRLPVKGEIWIARLDSIQKRIINRDEYHVRILKILHYLPWNGNRDGQSTNDKIVITPLYPTRHGENNLKITYQLNHFMTLYHKEVSDEI